MADPASNDNQAARGADGHGQAAMLLVESLLHGLIARSVISVADAVEIVGTAADVRREMAAEAPGPPAPADASATLLAAVGASLAIDLPVGG